MIRKVGLESFAQLFFAVGAIFLGYLFPGVGYPIFCPWWHLAFGLIAIVNLVESRQEEAHSALNFAEGLYAVVMLALPGITPYLSSYWAGFNTQFWFIWVGSVPLLVPVFTLVILVELFQVGQAMMGGDEKEEEEEEEEK